MIFKYIGGDSSSPTGDTLWSSSDTLSENIVAALDTTSKTVSFNVGKLLTLERYVRKISTPQRVRLNAP